MNDEVKFLAVKILKKIPVAINGIVVELLKEGEVKNVPEALAHSLVNQLKVAVFHNEEEGKESKKGKAENDYSEKASEASPENKDAGKSKRDKKDKKKDKEEIEEE